MTRLTFALALAASTAAAETVTLSDVTTDGDTATLTLDGAYSAALVYSNTHKQRSVSGRWPITSGHLSCEVQIVVGSGEVTAETATIHCPTGWAVDPASATVEDGEEFTFMLRYAAYQSAPLTGTNAGATPGAPTPHRSAWQLS